MPRRRENSPDDEDARRERARALRSRIEEIIDADDDSPQNMVDESPRDFIHRRMREVSREAADEPQELDPAHTPDMELDE